MAKKKTSHVTIKDVAKALHVAVSTVSNAYNRPDQLSSELRQQILEKASELGYAGPNPVARGLRRQKTSAIGMVYSERLSYAFSDWAAVMVLRGVASVVEDAALGLLLIPGLPSEEQRMEMLHNAMVGGFIIYSMEDEDALIQSLLSRQLPAVAIDAPTQVGIPYVTIDDYRGAYMAARHLTDLGHRHIAIITDRCAVAGQAGLTTATHHLPMRSGVEVLRLKGYQAALQEVGICWDEVLIYETARNHEHDGALGAQILLDTRPDLTAIVGITDRLALGAMQAARQRGLTLPHDLSVVGFDDIEDAAYADPPLTTIYQPHFEKGKIAAQLLLGLLNHETLSPVHTLPIELRVRASTAPPRWP